MYLSSSPYKGKTSSCFKISFMEITENISLNGGANVGWANATWPFAKLNVTSNRLELNTYLLGNFIFQPMDIISIVPYSGASPFKNGIKIIHSVENYNQKIVFWTSENAISVINKIKHFGFVQPGDLNPILEQTGVFVLPSRFEPWGVVVQEYAAAGYPLVLSNEVGAKEAFLEEGKNGFSFPAKNIGELKKQLKKIMDLSSKDLLLMSEKSHGLAQKISPQKWAAQVKEIYERSPKK